MGTISAFEKALLSSQNISALGCLAKKKKKTGCLVECSNSTAVSVFNVVCIINLLLYL